MVAPLDILKSYISFYNTVKFKEIFLQTMVTQQPCIAFVLFYYFKSGFALRDEFSQLDVQLNVDTWQRSRFKTVAWNYYECMGIDVLWVGLWRKYDTLDKTSQHGSLVFLQATWSSTLWIRNLALWWQLHEADQSHWYAGLCFCLSHILLVVHNFKYKC